MTFPNLERAGLVGDPIAGESMYDLLVLSHLVHDLSRHLGDQRGQQGLGNVLEARLHQQFKRAGCSRCVLPDTVSFANEFQRISGMMDRPHT